LTISAENCALDVGKAQADAFYWRYCDFWLVDGEKELNVPSLRQFAPPLPRKVRHGERRSDSDRAGQHPLETAGIPSGLLIHMISFENFTLPYA
jgi:hypothetical protein